MSRKLFLSFLGTGFYGECTYFDANADYAPTRFIQAATLEQVGACRWTERDAVRIFVTNRAFDDNWDPDNRARRKYAAGPEEPYERLGSVLGKMGLRADVAAVRDVPDGGSGDEIWKIFEMVYGQIEEGDELYIDATHGFRYMPMLVLVLCNYAKFLKGVTVKRISYGNFEARDESRNRAPIVDLMPLVELQGWTVAAADFVNNGYVEGLKSMAQSLAGDEGVRFVALLDEFASERQTCRGPKITGGDTAGRLCAALSGVTAPQIPPLEPIAHKLRREVAAPSETMARVLDAAQWCFRNHMWQQSLTILQEGIVSLFCQRHGIDENSNGLRKVVNRAFNLSLAFKPYPKKRIKWKAYGDLPKILELLEDELVADRQVSKCFSDISNLRNNYNHAGFGHKDIAPQDIEKVISTVRDVLMPKVVPGFKAEPYHFKSKVFINISNHLSSSWGDKQREAAEAYGTIEDIGFPHVPADADEGSIDDTAKKIAKKIFDTYDDTVDITVHVMGEMTLTYALVNILKTCGVRCVASCSDRKVEERSDGSKVSYFEFAGFRKY